MRALHNHHLNLPFPSHLKMEVLQQQPGIPPKLSGDDPAKKTRKKSGQENEPESKIGKFKGLVTSVSREIRIDHIDYIDYFKRNPDVFTFPAYIQVAICTRGHS